jgi:hypothetical protein
MQKPARLVFSKFSRPIDSGLVSRRRRPEHRYESAWLGKAEQIGDPIKNDWMNSWRLSFDNNLPTA